MKAARVLRARDRRGCERVDGLRIGAA